MKIILVITDSQGKSLLYITDSLEILTPEKAAKLIDQGKLTEVHAVKTKTSIYIRSNKNQTITDNLDNISVTKNQLEKGYIDYSTLLFRPEMMEFEKIKQPNITEANPKDIINVKYEVKKKIVTKPRRTKQQVFNHLNTYKDIILEAAKNQDIDVHLLGAILIDEYCRMGIDDVLDFLGAAGINTSMGIAQIKLKTARKIIKRGYYTPDSSKDLSKALAPVLYLYLRNPYHSAQLAAANIRGIINDWKKLGFDISNKLEHIGYYYCTGEDIIGKPKTFYRSEQIKDDFYPLAKKIF